MILVLWSRGCRIGGLSNVGLCVTNGFGLCSLEVWGLGLYARNGGGGSHKSIQRRVSEGHESCKRGFKAAIPLLPGKATKFKRIAGIMWSSLRLTFPKP